VDILFNVRKFAKQCNDFGRLKKYHGEPRAKLIRRRLDELRAANSLETMRSLLQARCHELKGKRAGQLSVDLGHPYRLVFKVANNPIPTKPDGGLDWTKVTAIEIFGVEDTHE